MKVVAAYLLAVLGGNTCPSADDLKKILASVGAEADIKKMEEFLSQVKGKDTAELVASGREKLASVPSGVAVDVNAPAAGGADADADADAAAAAEKKEEDKVEEEEDEDIGGLFGDGGLFGND